MHVEDREPAVAAARAGSMLDELLTAEQLAQRLQMKRSTIEDYARRQILPSIMLGRHRRFVIRDVEQTLPALRQPVRRPRRVLPR
jgi:excisionase family DNA binding protein